jgi:hypothetical protein
VSLESVLEVVRTLEAKQADLDALEARLAATMEDLSQERAVAAAYEQGRADERRRVLALLQEQRQWLGRGGVNAVSLEVLAGRVG